MRIVEFLLPRLDVHVGVGQLAEIDFWACHGETAHRALDGHVAQHQRRQPFRRKPIYGVHRNTVAMGVNQLFVDPVPAALRELVDVQFAGGEHHLAHVAVDFITVNVDVGKVVVGADFLNLTQRVLECMHVPQPDVLKRRLIVGGIGRLDGRLSGKLALGEPVQSVGLPRQVDVVGNIGLLANQLVRFDDKAADVPADCLKGDITDRGRKDCRDKPAPT